MKYCFFSNKLLHEIHFLGAKRKSTAAFLKCALKKNVSWIKSLSLFLSPGLKLQAAGGKEPSWILYMCSVTYHCGTAGVFYNSLFLLGSVTECLLVSHSPPLTMKKPERTEAGVSPSKWRFYEWMNYPVCKRKGELSFTCTDSRDHC